jgi:hypothetical protein
MSAPADSSLPTEGTPESKILDSARDEKLDSLLGRVAPPLISAGFADRVIQSVAPNDARAGANVASKWTRNVLVAVAASVTLCVGLVWFNNPPTGKRSSGTSNFPAATTDEEVLLKALTTLEVNSGDLALVAQLGKVLEAELSEKTSWLETD